MTKLLRYLKPYTTGVMLVVGLVFVQSMSSLYLPNLMSEIVDKGVARGDTAFIWRTGGLMLLVALVGSICAIAASYLSARISSGFGRDLRNRVFSHVEQFSLKEFDRFGTASLITRTTNDITQIQQVVLVFMRMVINAPIMCVGGLIMAISMDTRLSWVLAASAPIIALVMIWVTTKGMPLHHRVSSSKTGGIVLAWQQVTTAPSP